MILGASAISQIVQALVCLILGAFGAALWLFLDKVPMIKPLRILSDTLLILAITIAFIACIQRLNKGEILMFQPISILVGFYLVWKFLPKLIPYLTPSLSPKLFVSKGKVRKLFKKLFDGVNAKFAKLKVVFAQFFGKIKSKFQVLYKNTRKRTRHSKNELPPQKEFYKGTDFVDERTK